MAAFLRPPMLTQEQTAEIRVMARRGVAVNAIARELGVSPNTVRRYLRDAKAHRYKKREPRASKIDEHMGYLAARVDQARPRWIPATVLMREIQERGYRGGISTLKAWLAPHKGGVADPVVRFETAPGEQLQADFTHVRRGRDPLVALVATLGYSRTSYVRFGNREDADALCTGLRDAFCRYPLNLSFRTCQMTCIASHRAARRMAGSAIHRSVIRWATGRGKEFRRGRR
jgi:transposase